MFSKYREDDIICSPFEVIQILLGLGLRNRADDDESVHDADVAFPSRPSLSLTLLFQRDKSTGPNFIPWLELRENTHAHAARRSEEEGSTQYRPRKKVIPCPQRAFNCPVPSRKLPIFVNGALKNHPAQSYVYPVFRDLVTLCYKRALARERINFHFHSSCLVCLVCRFSDSLSHSPVCALCGVHASRRRLPPRPRSPQPIYSAQRVSQSVDARPVICSLASFVVKLLSC